MTIPHVKNDQKEVKSAKVFLTKDYIWSSKKQYYFFLNKIQKLVHCLTSGFN